jgi:hypothetical protein
VTQEPVEPSNHRSRCYRLFRVFEEVFPFARYWSTKRKKLLEANAPTIDSSIYNGESDAILNERLKSEVSRGAAMDEKTFKMTLSLSFGIAVLATLSPRLLSDLNHPALRALCEILIGLSVFYAFGGGFVALGAMRTLPTYGIRGSGIPSAQSGARKKFLAEAIARNEALSIVRHLRNETAYMAIRNGFICLSVALAIVLLDRLMFFLT